MTLVRWRRLLQAVAEAEAKFRCGGMNMYYPKSTNLYTISITCYAKYTKLGVAAATACQIASSATARELGWVEPIVKNDK